MFFKYIILDLDDTIYNYSLCHSISITEVFNLIHTKYDINTELIIYKYKEISNELKNILGNTASSHNKFIYFKHLVEYFKLDYSFVEELNVLYWNTFLHNIKLNNYIEEFLKWSVDNNIKLAILTDYQCEYQFKKLTKMNILHYFNYILTSEETGHDKPHKMGYLEIMNYFNCNNSEIIMIGDNYNKDILGANILNIYGYLFLNDKEIIITNNNLFENFNNFQELLTKFNFILNELNRLEKISKYCGERFDLTQACGGNSSVKYGDIMFIKASGFHLTNINNTNGYVVINNKLLKADIQDNKFKSLSEYNIFNNKRASIETYMHSILKKYTIHLHPIQINKILISKKCDDFINQYFPNSLLIEYNTPGINICKDILNTYNNEEIIFLKNHGIIISVDEYEKLIPMLENILSIFEKKMNINFDKYKFVNQISKHINNNYENILYLCDDKIINDYLFNKKELFLEKVTFPDALIFCGINILFIDNLDELDIYFEIHKEYPKVIIIRGLIYIINISLQKCKDTEDVLKANLMILDTIMEKTYLKNEEICYLNNWDDEKYRKVI